MSMTKLLLSSLDKEGKAAYTILILREKDTCPVFQIQNIEENIKEE